MQVKSTHDRNYEPIARVDQRLREQNQPTGLRNIGNTCYFNSLLQVYYTLPRFVSEILKFEVQMIEDEEGKANVPMASGAQPKQDEGPVDNSALKKKLVNSGMKLIRELQILFTTMAVGSKKYLDPNGVLESVLDDQGDQVAIGEEKDIAEYNSMLLTRIQDAFNWKKQQQEASKKPKAASQKPSATEPAASDASMDDTNL